MSTSAGVLYSGVVCTGCSRVTCSSCHGTRPDAPCTHCNSPVRPAFEDLLPNSHVVNSSEGNSPALFDILTPLGCGACSADFSIGLTHYLITSEWKLDHDPRVEREILHGEARLQRERQIGIKGIGQSREEFRTQWLMKFKLSPEQFADVLSPFTPQTDLDAARQNYEIVLAAEREKSPRTWLCPNCKTVNRYPWWEAPKRRPWWKYW